MYRDNRPGCLMGLLQFFLLDKVFRWLQRGIGFGSGSLLGCGCGPILFVIRPALRKSNFWINGYMKVLHILHGVFLWIGKSAWMDSHRSIVTLEVTDRTRPCAE